MGITNASVGGILVAACLGLGATGSAWADEPAAPANAASGEDRAKAQEHYDAGKRAYDIGEFDEAIVEWKKAYQYFGAPDFLFNIAQAYRQKRDYDDAIFFFNAYLRAQPDAPNRAQVEALRDEMVGLREREMEMRRNPPQDVQPVDAGGTEGTTKVALPSEAPTQPAPTAPGPVDAPSSGSSLRMTGMIAGGTGVALFATGIAFALSASSTQSDLEAAAERNEAWSDRLEEMEESGARNATIGTSLMVVGGLGIVGGAIAYYLGMDDDSESSLTVTPTVDPSGDAFAFTMGMSF